MLPLLGSADQESSTDREQRDAQSQPKQATSVSHYFRSIRQERQCKLGRNESIALGVIWKEFGLPNIATSRGPAPVQLAP
jgi:hypothetical protein